MNINEKGTDKIYIFGCFFFLNKSSNSLLAEVQETASGQKCENPLLLSPGCIFQGERFKRGQAFTHAERPPHSTLPTRGHLPKPTAITLLWGSSLHCENVNAASCLRFRVCARRWWLQQHPLKEILKNLQHVCYERHLGSTRLAQMFSFPRLQPLLRINKKASGRDLKVISITTRVSVYYYYLVMGKVSSLAGFLVTFFFFLSILVTCNL